MAALHLCTRQDYERVTIRKLAKESRVSISTFSDRFGSLRAFWYAVAGAQFQAATMAMNREFIPEAWGDASPEKIVRRFVEHIVTGLDGDSIGITRMCAKMDMNAPLAAKPFRDYRAAITDRAVKLLEDKVKAADPEEAIRQAMRAALAIAVDTTWQNNGPLLSRERELMIDEVTGLMCRSLSLPIPRKRINRLAVEDSEKAMIASFNAPLHDQLPIYKMNLNELEKTVNASRKPEVKLPTGRGIDPEDAYTLYAKNRKPEVEKRLEKPKRIGRMI